MTGAGDREYSGDGVGLALLGGVVVAALPGVALTVTERRVLAAFALHAGQSDPIDTETLCELLWSGLALDRARARLRTQVWRLRSGGVLDAAGVTLRGTRRGWWVALDRGTDADRFAEASTGALSAMAAQSPRQRLDSLSAAWDLWSGHPAPELGSGRDDLEQIVRLESIHRELTLTLAEVGVEVDRCGPNVAEAVRLLTIADPADSRGWIALASSLQVLGATVDALRAVGDGKAALQRAGLPTPDALIDLERVLLRADRPVSSERQDHRSHAGGHRPTIRGGEENPETLAAIRAVWRDLAGDEMKAVVVAGAVGLGVAALCEVFGGEVLAERGQVVVFDGDGWRRAVMPEAPEAPEAPRSRSGSGPSRTDPSLVAVGPHLRGADVAPRGGTRSLALVTHAGSGSGPGSVDQTVLRVIMQLHGRHLGGSSLMVVVAVEELSACWPSVASAVRRIVGAEHVSVHHLRPWGGDALVAARPTASSWAIDACGGNLGLLDLLFEGGAGHYTLLPPAFLRRIARLVDGVEPVALAHLLAHTAFDGTLDLEGILGLEGEPSIADLLSVLECLDGLAAEGLVVSDERGTRFASAVIRDAVGSLGSRPSGMDDTAEG